MNDFLRMRKTVIPFHARQVVTIEKVTVRARNNYEKNKIFISYVNILENPLTENTNTVIIQTKQRDF